MGQSIGIEEIKVDRHEIRLNLAHEQFNPYSGEYLCLLTSQDIKTKL